MCDNLNAWAKRKCVGIFILGGGSIEVFNLDDEHLKWKVNGLNGCPKKLEGNPERKIPQQVAIYCTRGLRC